MRCSDFKYYYRQLQSLGIDHIQVLSNYELTIYDQELANRGRRHSDVDVIRNSSFYSNAEAHVNDKKLQDNYQYLEHQIKFNRLVNRQVAAKKTGSRFTKKDFSFGKLQMSKPQPINTVPITADYSVTDSKAFTNRSNYEY